MRSDLVAVKPGIQHSEDQTKRTMGYNIKEDLRETDTEEWKRVELAQNRDQRLAWLLYLFAYDSTESKHTHTHTPERTNVMYGLISEAVAAMTTKITYSRKWRRVVSKKFIEISVDPAPY